MPSAWEWPTTDKKETGTIRFDDAGITITRNGQMRWLSDAYMGHFTPWLDGRPELSAEAHALLRRRRQALAGKISGLTDQLKDELADIGVVVRDRGQQEVRRLKSR